MVLVLITVTNVFVCFTVSAFTFMQLLSNGANKYVAFLCSCIIAIYMHLYIAHNHKISNWILVNKETK